MEQEKNQKHLTDRQQNESKNYSMNTQWNIRKTDLPGKVIV